MKQHNRKTMGLVLDLLLLSSLLLMVGLLVGRQGSGNALYLHSFLLDGIIHCSDWLILLLIPPFTFLLPILFMLDFEYILWDISIWGLYFGLPVLAGCLLISLILSAAAFRLISREVPGKQKTLRLLAELVLLPNVILAIDACCLLLLSLEQEHIPFLPQGLAALSLCLTAGIPAATGFFLIKKLQLPELKLDT